MSDDKLFYNKPTKKVSKLKKNYKKRFLLIFSESLDTHHVDVDNEHLLHE
jgi:hypothetical protein